MTDKAPRARVPSEGTDGESRQGNDLKSVLLKSDQSPVTPMNGPWSGPLAPHLHLLRKAGYCGDPVTNGDNGHRRGDTRLHVKRIFTEETRATRPTCVAHGRSAGASERQGRRGRGTSPASSAGLRDQPQSADLNVSASLHLQRKEGI